MARSVEWYDSDAGLVVTASHNPPADNGFKFWTRGGQAFESEATDRLSQRVTAASTLTVPPGSMGAVRTAGDASRRHLDRLPDGDLSPLSVVLDLGNGVGQLTADALLSLGCDVTTLDAQRDGTFPSRPSEPTADHCTLLSTVVSATGADLGIAHDGDADRMMAVDETGRFVEGDELLALFAADAAPAGESVAAPINASALVDAVVAESGGSVVRTAVGDGNVATACTDSDVAFGGEPSGAWIWPGETLAPDGHYAACRLAAIVSGGRPLSERIAAFPTYVTKRESFACENKGAVIAATESRVRDRYDDVTGLDGVRVDRDDGWFLLRASGTEPVVRVTAEAETERLAAERLREATEFVRPDPGPTQD